MLASGSGYLCLAASGTLSLIMLSLLLVGVGTALHHAPSSSLVANSHNTSIRTGALGLYNASGDVGKLLFTGCFGFAVGLGNIWRVPYVAGESGGAAFVLVYLACAFGIGVPIVMAELLIGRRGRMSPPESMRRLALAARRRKPCTSGEMSLRRRCCGSHLESPPGWEMYSRA